MSETIGYGQIVASARFITAGHLFNGADLSVYDDVFKLLEVVAFSQQVAYGSLYFKFARSHSDEGEGGEEYCVNAKTLSNM